MALRIYTGARGERFVCDDTRGFGDQVAFISHAADAPVVSCAREQAAEPLLARIGKRSQRELYKCAQAKINTGACPPACDGNCNPANPPGASTHERRNDGAAYTWWPRLFRLPAWARGIDVQRDRVAAFCNEARGQGFTVTLTYPGSPSESQHVNFRREPKISLWKVRPWRPGMGGARGREIRRVLTTILDPQTRQPYLRRGVAIEQALRAFQRDHHQKQDAIVGVHTIRALRAVKRRSPHLTSQGGIQRIRGFEGVRLEPYNDPAGHATIGVGHLIHAGPVTQADRDHYRGFTIADADKLLMRDLVRFEAPVRAAAPWATQPQFDSLVSATFNLGPGVLEQGRSLGDALRSPARGRNRRVVDALLEYVKDRPGGDILPGLIRRRQAEAESFLT